MSSDNSVYTIMLGMPGVKNRLYYLRFKGASEAEFLKYMQENKDALRLKNESDRKRFYEVFGSNFRRLDGFVIRGNETMEGIKYC